MTTVREEGQVLQRRGVIISEIRVFTFGYATIQKILNTFGALK